MTQEQFHLLGTEKAKEMPMLLGAEWDKAPVHGVCLAPPAKGSQQRCHAVHSPIMHVLDADSGQTWTTMFHLPVESALYLLRTLLRDSTTDLPCLDRSGIPEHFAPVAFEVPDNHYLVQSPEADPIPPYIADGGFLKSNTAYDKAPWRDEVWAAPGWLTFCSEAPFGTWQWVLPPEHRGEKGYLQGTFTHTLTLNPEKVIRFRLPA